MLFVVFLLLFQYIGDAEGCVELQHATDDEQQNPQVAACPEGTELKDLSRHGGCREQEAHITEQLLSAQTQERDVLSFVAAQHLHGGEAQHTCHEQYHSCQLMEQIRAGSTQQKYSAKAEDGILN